MATTAKRRSCAMIACAMGLAVHQAAWGQAVGYDPAGPEYFQNFNTLPASTSTTGYTNGLVQTAYPVPSQGDRSGVFAGTYTGLAGWYLYDAMGAETRFTVDNAGTSNSGSMYSYGFNGVNALTDRALGAASSSSEAPWFGLALQNTGSVTLNRFTLSYRGEQYRKTTNAQSLAFSYLLAPAFTASDVAAAGTSATSLNFAAPVTGTAGGMDGNAAGNYTPITATVSGLNWEPGQILWLRWNKSGSTSPGLAIDDLTFSAMAGAPPNNSVLTVNGGLKTLTVDVGRTLYSKASPTQVLTLSNGGADATALSITGETGGIGNATSPLAGGASTPLTVGVSASVTAKPGGSTYTAKVNVRGDNAFDDPVVVNLTGYVVENRFVNNIEGSNGVMFGKMLVGQSLEQMVMLQTNNLPIDPPAQPMDQYFANVTLKAETTATGTIGSGGIAGVSMAAGRGDVAFDGTESWEYPTNTYRPVTVTGLKSGATKPAASAGYITYNLRYDDTAPGGADGLGNALTTGRVYVDVKVYQPAAVTGDNPEEGKFRLLNAAGNDNGTRSLRADALVLGGEVSVSTFDAFALITDLLGSVVPGGDAAASGAPAGVVEGAYLFYGAGKLAGVYTGEARFHLQHADPTMLGAANNDLPDAIVPLSATVLASPPDQVFQPFTAGTLTTTNAVIGDVGVGAFVQQGGKHVAGGVLTLGAQAGSTGSYQLVAGALEVAGVHNNGTFQQDGGSLKVTGTFTSYGTTTLAGTQDWASGSLLAVREGQTVLQSDLGAGTGRPNVQVGSPAQPTLVGGVVTGPRLNVQASQHLAQVDLGPNAVMAMAPAGNRVLVVNGLTLASHLDGEQVVYDAQLDLADNDLIVDYQAGQSPLAGLRAMIQAASSAGWTGNGLTSSSAAATSGLTALAAIDNDLDGDGPGTEAWTTTFAGQAVDASSILVKYTYVGDTNLDGAINSVDFANQINGFNQGLGNWQDGDTNGDASVNSVDFANLINSFNQQGEPLSGAATSVGGVVAVPEPASLGLLLLGGIVLLWRRKPAQTA